MKEPNPYQVPHVPGSRGQSRVDSRVRIRRVGVASLGVFMGAAGAAGGLLASGFIVLIAALGIAAEEGLNIGPAESVVFLILPVVYGVLGFVAGVIYALIFNVIAVLTGGLEIELASTQEW